jgi:two-component system OmpR family response regulator
MSHAPGALEKLSTEQFDLVILDVIMPEMTGFEVCERIRKMDSYSETPILMLTAKSGDEDRQRGLEAGANLYLPKPIAPRQLIALVEEALK